MVAVVVFARAPVPGAVKRRLLPALTPRAIAELHRRMVFATVETAIAAGVGPVELWCAPNCDHPFFRSLSTRYGVATFEQEGLDLGGRMAHAFESTLARHGATILVGTDCPSLELGDLQSAAEYLAAGDDAVLGPACDGGYVLLGLHRADPCLFRDISWGEASVLDATRERLSSLGWRWRELSPHRDIDRPEDLAYLPAHLRVGLALRPTPPGEC